MEKNQDLAEAKKKEAEASPLKLTIFRFLFPRRAGGFFSRTASIAIFTRISSTFASLIRGFAFILLCRFDGFVRIHDINPFNGSSLSSGTTHFKAKGVSFLHGNEKNA